MRPCGPPPHFKRSPDEDLEEWMLLYERPDLHDPEDVEELLTGVRTDERDLSDNEACNIRHHRNNYSRETLEVRVAVVVMRIQDRGPTHVGQCARCVHPPRP
ncbi:hypothetical protein HPB47_012820 [Ixodes persulcatus]|uniref:Uncharacterized protein n=1 Tax=Ixodes persulcatus TaxID=34615 RepID=A0AC60NSH8_IXOPE|nr:hypothetical protein HPB47_012820 [Ixodes persulcatus]